MPSDNFSHWIAAPGSKPRFLLYVDGCPDVFAAGDEPVDEEALEEAVGSVRDMEAASANVASLLATGDMTFGIWLRPETGRTGSNGIFEYHDATNGYAIYTSPSALVVEVKATAQTFTLALTDDVWQFIGVAIGGDNGPEVRAYKLLLDADGAYVSETDEVRSWNASASRTTRAAWSFSEEIRIGQVNNAATLDRWYGQWCHALLFQRALARHELRTLPYWRPHAGWPLYATGLIGWWPGNEGSGSTIADRVGGRPLSVVAGGWDTEVPFDRRVLNVMGTPTSVSQEIDILSTRSSVSGFTVRLIETDNPSDSITEWIAGIALALRKRAATLFMGFEGMQEAEYELVFAGSVESLQPVIGRGWELRVNDARARAKVPLVLGKTTCTEPIDSSETGIDVVSIKGFGAKTKAEQAAAVAFDAYVRCDDEIMAITGYTVGGTQRFTVTRGALGTTAATHANGAKLEEVLVIRNVHPLQVLMELLTSGTGGGQVIWTDWVSSWDSLCVFTTDNDKDRTDGRGAGLGPTELDADGIINDVAPSMGWGGSTYNGSLLIGQDIDDIKRWCEENILRPLRAFFFVKSDGRLSIGYWDDRAAGATLIEAGDMSRPQASILYDKIVNNVIVRYDQVVTSGEHAQVQAYEDVDSGGKHGRGELYEVKSPWLRTNDFGGASLTPTTVTAALKTTLFARFGAPVYMVEATLTLEWMQTEIDTVLKLQHPHLPDLALGWRGLQAVDFQVIGKTVDFRRGRVVLKLIRMP